MISFEQFFLCLTPKRRLLSFPYEIENLPAIGQLPSSSRLEFLAPFLSNLARHTSHFLAFAPIRSLGIL